MNESNIRQFPTGARKPAAERMKEAIAQKAAFKKIADAATLENRGLFAVVARHSELKAELREEMRCVTGWPPEAFERWFQEKLAQEILRSRGDVVQS